MKHSQHIRSKWTIGLSLIALTVVISFLISGWALRRSERGPEQGGARSGHIGATSYTTLSGTMLKSFFEGLPIDGRFANGRIPAGVFKAASQAASCKAAPGANYLARMLPRMQHFLGLASTVHPQDGPCTGCYQKQDTPRSCQPNCSGVQQVTIVDHTASAVGSYNSPDTGCNPPNCVADDWLICINYNNPCS
jgi:hypothetical protein